MPGAHSPYDLDAFNKRTEEELASHLAADPALHAATGAARAALADGRIEDATRVLTAALAKSQAAAPLPRKAPPTAHRGGRGNLTASEGARCRQLRYAAAAYDAVASLARNGDPACEARVPPPPFDPEGGVAVAPPPAPLPRPPVEDPTSGSREVDPRYLSELQAWSVMVDDAAKECRARARSLEAYARIRAGRRACGAFRSRMLTRRKKATRALFQTGPGHSLTEVVTRGGVSSSAPADVLAEVAAHFTALQTPAGEVDLDNPPWEMGEDPVVVAADRPGGPAPEPPRLSDRVTREVVEAALRRTPRKRAPGPDGVLGETLRCAPDDVIDVIVSLHQAMWGEAFVPTPLKRSVTTLLYKKGDPREVGNYRPIALASTIAKSFTMVVTDILSAFAEEAGVLSATQEGFRPQRNTTRQIRLVTSVLEDARLASRDVTLTYVDFSSAFNTVPHGGLMRVMKDLGFPEDARAVVAALYDGAATEVATPYGKTGVLPILTGTIQGDCLSPLLWNIFMEPLLRWLDSGGRGYRFATSDETVSAGAYADDLVLTTNNRAEARAQMAKVAAFAAWSGLRVNLKKCAHTALVAGAAPTGHQRSLPYPGTPGVPWLPPGSAYTYLGVELTATLDWKADLAAAGARIHDRAAVITASPASIRQKMMLLGGNAVMAAAYKLASGGFTPTAVDDLDRLVARYAKTLWRSPRGVAGDFVFLPQDLHGAGIPSVRSQMTKAYPRILLESLRDGGRLGRVTRGLVVEHLRRGSSGGDAEGVALHPAYKSTLPTANLLRALGPLRAELVGVEAPAGAGGLLRLAAERDLQYEWEHARRPPAARGRYWALLRLWASSCYSLADVTDDPRWGRCPAVGAHT